MSEVCPNFVRAFCKIKKSTQTRLFRQKRNGIATERQTTFRLRCCDRPKPTLKSIARASNICPNFVRGFRVWAACDFYRIPQCVAARYENRVLCISSVSADLSGRFSILFLFLSEFKLEHGRPSLPIPSDVRTTCPTFGHTVRTFPTPPDVRTSCPL